MVKYQGSYPGPERRAATQEHDSITVILEFIRASTSEKKYLGLKINEIVIIGTVILGIAAFYIRTNDTIDRLVKITDSLTSFTRNSDSWHSTVVGTTFDQGKPSNPNFDNSKIRKIVQTDKD